MVLAALAEQLVEVLPAQLHHMVVVVVDEVVLAAHMAVVAVLAAVAVDQELEVL